MTPTRAPIVPFNRTYTTGAEQQYMTTAIANGLLEGDGPFTRRANALIAEIIGASAVLLTTSCTHALEMSALLLNLAPGDEVIVPSFTFVSTATAIALRGAVPVFADCRPDTLNLDERRIETAITSRTRAIIVVHYAGVACDMDMIMSIAGRYGLAVIEDNAHGLGGRYKCRPLGSFGALAAQSFHATKNIQCGEGGALVINDSQLIERAEIIREKGTNRSQFFRGMVDKYRWVENGSSYLPSDLLAAFLVAQLEAIDDIQRRRHRIWTSYDERLADWAEGRGIGRPTVPAECEHSAHLYYLLLPDLTSRQSFLHHLVERGVRAAFHYQPLHTAPGGLRYGRVAPGGCEVTENVADRIIRLPLFAEMSDTELDLVVESVISYNGPK